MLLNASVDENQNAIELMEIDDCLAVKSFHKMLRRIKKIGKCFKLSFSIELKSTIHL